MKVSIFSKNPTFSYQFQCKDKGVIGVYGVSGSGKSSLLNALAGFSATTTGSIEFNNKFLLDTKNKQKPAVVKCSYMQQHPVLFPHWSVAKNLAFAQAYGQQRHDVDFYLDELACKSLVHKFPHQLSGGEQQRIAFIRTLLLIDNNSLVLLDEPLTALNESLKEKAIALLARQENCLMFLVTHEINQLYRLADSILCLKKGKVSYHDSCTNAMSSEQSNLPIASQIYFEGDKHIIYADDVSISLNKHHDSSIVHQITAKIIAIEIKNNSAKLKLELHKDYNSQILYAKITQHSLQRLELKVQQTVFANFKATSYQPS